MMTNAALGKARLSLLVNSGRAEGATNIAVEGRT
jgi:hypothetical protein